MKINQSLTSPKLLNKNLKDKEENLTYSNKQRCNVWEV